MSRDPEIGKARAFALKAQQAKDHHEWQSMTALARSNILLEVNARWLASTDRFIEAVKAISHGLARTSQFQRTLASSECGPRLMGRGGCMKRCRMTCRAHVAGCCLI